MQRNLLMPENAIDKIQVMKNKCKLINLSDKRNYINENMTKQQREIHKTTRIGAEKEN